MAYRRCSILLAATVVVAGALTGRADTVQRVGDGRSVGGTVVERSRTVITVRRPNERNVTVPANEIEAIRYDGEPPKLNLGRVAERRGDLDTALRFYRESASGTGEVLSQPVREEIEFYVARCTAKLAQNQPELLPEAATQLERFRDQHADSHYYFPLHESLGTVYAAQGRTESARQAFEVVRSAPWKDSRLRARVAEGRLLQGEKKHEAAVALFDEILAEGGGTPEAERQLRAARLAKASSLVGLERYEEAEALIEEVIDDAPPEDSIQAEAHNALGDCLRAAGRPAKEALLAYLYVDLLCASEREQHAKALFYLSQLWEDIGRPARAEDALDRLKAEHPNSVWAKQ